MTAEEKLREELKSIIQADRESMEKAKERWKSVGKPLFSLGKLEDAVIKIAGIKGKPAYSLDKKGLVIMCADNGVVAEGVTQTGQEVTAIVAENFTKKETSVCLMAEVAGAELFPVDIGMATDVPGVTRPAMSSSMKPDILSGCAPPLRPSGFSWTSIFWVSM